MTNPPALDTLTALHALLRVRGNERYDGEDVSHLEHELQCATLARRAGAAPTLGLLAVRRPGSMPARAAMLPSRKVTTVGRPRRGLDG